MEEFISKVKTIQNLPIAKDHKEILDYITESTCSYDELILQISKDEDKMAKMSSLIEASTEYCNSLKSVISNPPNLE